MSTDASKAKIKVTLHKRLIVADGLIFNVEREVYLPMQPFVGLHLYNTEWKPPGCDESDDNIEEIACDLKTGRIVCYLPLEDFRLESSGCDWAEEEVLRYYQDWILQQDNPQKAAGGHEYN